MGSFQSRKKNNPHDHKDPLREQRSQSLRSASSTTQPVKRQTSAPLDSFQLERKSSFFIPKSPPKKSEKSQQEYKNAHGIIISTPAKRNRSFSMPYKVIPLNVSEESMWRELNNSSSKKPMRSHSSNSIPNNPEGGLLRRFSKANKSDQDIPSILVTPPKETSNLEHLSPSQKRKCLAKTPSLLSGLKTPYIIETGEKLPKSPIFAKGVFINA